MGKNYRESLSEQLLDPTFKREWDAIDVLEEEGSPEDGELAAAPGAEETAET